MPAKKYRKPTKRKPSSAGGKQVPLHLREPNEEQKKLIQHRSSLYKPEYDQMLLTHMANGFSFESFAGVVNVCRHTLYEWCKKQQSFLDAYRQGKSKEHLWWENTYRKNCSGEQKGSASLISLRYVNHYGYKSQIDPSQQHPHTTNIQINAALQLPKGEELTDELDNLLIEGDTFGTE